MVFACPKGRLGFPSNAFSSTLKFIALHLALAMILKFHFQHLTFFLCIRSKLSGLRFLLRSLESDLSKFAWFSLHPNYNEARGQQSEAARLISPELIPLDIWPDSAGSEA